MWDYPRPPAIEPCPRRIRVVANGEELAATERAYRVLETSHPPTYYLPPDDIDLGRLQPCAGSSFCEWKGRAQYWALKTDRGVIERCAWSYPAPTARFAPITDYLAFYLSAMDACYVDGEKATAQPGGFYGGWVTSDLAGPFKGASGTAHW